MNVRNTHFLITVVRKEALPNYGNLPEIALIGKSNVGKSSLLNHLLATPHLAKTSSTPGKTRALNFFRTEGRLIWVDLPGYGYAAVSDAEKTLWAELLDHYLTQRETLKKLLFLFDIRREPTAEDLHMWEWICHFEVPAILVLTKVDKVGQSERFRQTQKITSRFKGLPYVHYSVTQNEGRKQLLALLRPVWEAKKL